MTGTPAIFPVADPTKSFWLSDPHPLAKFRSSEKVPEEVDIAIIGTGLAGVSTAYHILKSSRAGSKPSLTLLEARQACSGATGRNGGHVKVGSPTMKAWHEKHGPEIATQLIGWVAGQRRAMKRIAEEEGLDCQILVARSYDVFYDADQAAIIKDWLFALRGSGAEWLYEVQWLEGPYLDQVTGAKGAVAAIGLPVMSLWPYKYVTGLLARVHKMGATLYTETPVEAVDDSSDSGFVTLHTSRGTIRAKKLIYATNAYTSGLLPQYRGVIVPVRGQAARFTPANRTHHCPNPDTTYNLFHTPNSVDYLNPRPDGTIVLGGGSRNYRQAGDDRNGRWFNTVDDATLIDDGVPPDFQKSVSELLHGWEDSDAKLHMTWTGIMGNSVDGLPHAGLVPGKTNQWILAAFNGGGMALISTMAEAIAGMVVNGKDFDQAGIPAVFKSTQARIGKKFPV